MEPLYLLSEKTVYTYLKKFLKDNPHAAQLDGSTKAKKNGDVVIVFTYSIDGRKYKLSGDLTRKAAQAFIALADEHGSPAVVLKEYTSSSGREGLILATTTEPKGWNCWEFVNKQSDALKKAA